MFDNTLPVSNTLSAMQTQQNLEQKQLNWLSHIKIVMVNTTLPANIGSAARAMKTMGLSQLVLVEPKAFPSGDATALASGAADLLQHAQVCSNLQEAIADCELVFGASARVRSMPWPLVSPPQAAHNIFNYFNQHSDRKNNQHANQQTTHKPQIAIVFGREDRGLTNDELALCQYHLTIPVNDDYGVLNVAAAIQVVCYELRVHALGLRPNSQNDNQNNDQNNINPENVAYDNNELATKQAEANEPLCTQNQLEQFYASFEQMLMDIDLLDPNNKRQLPLKIRRLFGRIQMDRTEYNLLRGMIARVTAILNKQWPPQSLVDKRNAQTD